MVYRGRNRVDNQTVTSYLWPYCTSWRPLVWNHLTTGSFWLTVHIHVKPSSWSQPWLGICQLGTMCTTPGDWTSCMITFLRTPSVISYSPDCNKQCQRGLLEPPDRSHICPPTPKESTEFFPITTICCKIICLLIFFVSRWNHYYCSGSILSHFGQLAGFWLADTLRRVFPRERNVARFDNDWRNGLSLESLVWSSCLQRRVPAPHTVGTVPQTQRQECNFLSSSDSQHGIRIVSQIYLQFPPTASLMPSATW